VAKGILFGNNHRKLMKQMKFLKYFFYLATNWNIPIAWHILRNEIRGEKKYGINTTGADNLKSLEKKGIDISHATIYMPVSYDILELFFAEVKIESFNHFLDIGSGKARAMCVAASYGIKKVSGIELSKELFLHAKENIAITKEKYSTTDFEIYNNDAFYFDIDDDVDCIFMFNPFDETIMSGVMENIETSLENNPRVMTIIYINPLEKHVLLEWGYEEVFHSKKMHYLEGSVWVK
jgi:16S rRNA G966 N2-methylase RsmD